MNSIRSPKHSFMGPICVWMTEDSLLCLLDNRDHQPFASAPLCIAGSSARFYRAKLRFRGGQSSRPGWFIACAPRWCRLIVEQNSLRDRFRKVRTRRTRQSEQSTRSLDVTIPSAANEQRRRPFVRVDREHWISCCFACGFSQPISRQRIIQKKR